MKTNKYTLEQLAQRLNVPPNIQFISKLKSNLTLEIQNALSDKNMTHQELADLSGVPRSAITGILSGSLQRVSIDRLLRLISALGKEVEFKFIDAA